MDAELLTIGRLARCSGLTAKALRHYDRIGLLTPAHVDQVTGIRYYSDAQIAPATLIARLRAVDLPLDEVRRCLVGSAQDVRAVLLAHRARLTSRATRIAGDLHSLAHLIQDGTESAVVEAVDELLSGDTERRLAAQLFNGVWRLLEKEDRSTADDDRMVHMAHASRYHWGQVGAPVNRGRGEWQCSRVYAVLGRAEPCMFHAARTLSICQEHGIADFDIAFAYEALARAYAVAGDSDQARAMVERALAAVPGIAEDQDRAIVLADLETVPGVVRFW
jgi:DNA-binding transcriptional MerR regulator